MVKHQNVPFLLKGKVPMFERRSTPDLPRLCHSRAMAHPGTACPCPPPTTPGPCHSLGPSPPALALQWGQSPAPTALPCWPWALWAKPTHRGSSQPGNMLLVSSEHTAGDIPGTGSPRYFLSSQFSCCAEISQVREEIPGWVRNAIIHYTSNRRLFSESWLLIWDKLLMRCRQIPSASSPVPFCSPEWGVAFTSSTPEGSVLGFRFNHAGLELTRQQHCYICSSWSCMILIHFYFPPTASATGN